jgi:hypothetical protein
MRTAEILSDSERVAWRRRTGACDLPPPPPFGGTLDAELDGICPLRHAVPTAMVDAPPQVIVTAYHVTRQRIAGAIARIGR